MMKQTACSPTEQSECGSRSGAVDAAELALNVLTHNDLAPLVWQPLGPVSLYALRRTHRKLRAHGPLRDKLREKLLFEKFIDDWTFLTLVTSETGRGSGHFAKKRAEREAWGRG